MGLVLNFCECIGNWKQNLMRDREMARETFVFLPQQSWVVI